MSRESPGALIDARFVWTILSGMASIGLDQNALLCRAKLDPHALKLPNTRITQHDLARLVSTMTRVSQDEFWGLLSRPVRPGTFRMLCRILIQSRDLRSAIIDGCHFYHLLIENFVLRLRSDSDVSTIWITDTSRDLPTRAPVHGVVLFFVYGLICWLVGRKIPLIAVRHAYPMPSYSGALRPYYQAPQSFDCARSELQFDSTLLSLSIMPDEQRLSRFLASMPSALLVRFRDDASFSERVVALLRRNLTRDMSLEDVADVLMMTPQTLRRRLSEEGQQGFRGIKDRVRSAEAARLLAYPEMSTEEIAFQLGFAEVSTFHRAFRRWTGSTPSAFRSLRGSTLS